MFTKYKRFSAFFGVLIVLSAFTLPAEADSHASSEAVKVIRNRRGSWHAMRNQARREEKTRQREIQREHKHFENGHKMRFHKEDRQRQMRLNSHHKRIRNYKWKKRN